MRLYLLVTQALRHLLILRITSSASYKMIIIKSEAIVKKMWKDGIRLIVPMWRGDVYGNDLHNHTKEMFELNGTVADGIENIIYR